MREKIMAESTTTVWITEHDDAAVGFVVNEREDMAGNYEDLVDDGIAQGTFEEYLASWVSLEMPTDVLNGPAAARIAWIEEALGQ
jgi:hypothetical protein